MEKWAIRVGGLGIDMGFKKGEGLAYSRKLSRGIERYAPDFENRYEFKNGIGRRMMEKINIGIGNR